MKWPRVNPLTVGRTVFASFGGAVAPLLEFVWPLKATEAERNYWRHRALALADAVTQSVPAALATAGAGPAGVGATPPGVPPAGQPSELAELIAEVLTEHCHYGDKGGHYCTGTHYEHFTDYPGWREHVAPLIAERIEKATPPSPFTFGDLARAATVLSIYAEGLSFRGTHQARQELLALSSRLADASEADPNP